MRRQGDPERLVELRCIEHFLVVKDRGELVKDRRQPVDQSLCETGGLQASDRSDEQLFTKVISKLLQCLADCGLSNEKAVGRASGVLLLAEYQESLE